LDNWEVDINAIHYQQTSIRNKNETENIYLKTEINSSSSLNDFKDQVKNSENCDEDHVTMTCDNNDDNNSLTISEVKDRYEALPFFKEDPTVNLFHSYSSNSSLNSFFTSFTMRNKVIGTRLRSHSGGFIDPRSHPEYMTKYVDPRYRSWHWYSHFSPHEKIPGGTALLRRTQKIIDVGFSSQQFLLLGEVAIPRWLNN
jgi:hypothetical protein